MPDGVYPLLTLSFLVFSLVAWQMRQVYTGTPTLGWSAGLLMFATAGRALADSRIHQHGPGRTGTAPIGGRLRWHPTAFVPDSPRVRGRESTASCSHVRSEVDRQQLSKAPTRVLASAPHRSPENTPRAQPLRCRPQPTTFRRPFRALSTNPQRTQNRFRDRVFPRLYSATASTSTAPNGDCCLPQIFRIVAELVPCFPAASRIAREPFLRRIRIQSQVVSESTTHRTLASTDLCTQLDHVRICLRQHPVTLV